jgi:putative transposase
MAISFKGAHFPKEVILMGVRWYVAYPLSTRHVEELMEERGVELDHATINRWVIEYSGQLEEAFHRCKRHVWVSWRMDETYIKVKGEWHYLLVLKKSIVSTPLQSLRLGVYKTAR